MIGWLMLWLCIIVAFGVGAIVCGILERSPWGEQDDNGWRRVPPPPPKPPTPTSNLKSLPKP